MKRRNWLLRLTAVFMTVAMISVLMAGCAHEKEEPEQKDFKMSYDRIGLKDFEAVGENDKLILLANESTAEIAVQCKDSKEIWYSNPQDRKDDKIANGKYKNVLNSQLIVQYANKDKSLNSSNNYTGSIKKKTYAVKKIDNGIRFDFHFPREGFVVPVEYKLNEDGLQVSVVNSEIKEVLVNRILRYSILPYFGSGKAGEEGGVMVPDGCGAWMDFKKSVEDARRMSVYYAPVYGKDPVYTTTVKQNKVRIPQLPVFGICREQGGVYAYVEDGKALTAINAEPVNYLTEYGTAYFEGTFRGIDKTLLQEKDMSERSVIILAPRSAGVGRYTVHYGFLDKKNPTYSDLIAEMRTYLQPKLGLKQTENEKTNLYVDVLGQVAGKKSFLGILYETGIPLTDFYEAGEIVNALKGGGVDALTLTYYGWSKDIPYRKMTVDAKLSSALGGKKGFAALKKALGGNQDRLFIANDFAHIYKNGHGVSVNSNGIRNLSGGVIHEYPFLRSVFIRDVTQNYWSYLTPLSFSDKIQKFLKSSKKLPVDGIADMALGSNLYSDYHQSKIVERKVIGRDDAMMYTQKALEQLGNGYNGLLVYGGNDYAYRSASDIVGLPLSSSRYRIFDKDIPLIPMLLHGSLSYAGEMLNLQSDAETALLRMAEYGYFPYYQFADTSEKLLTETEYSYLTSPSFLAWSDTVLSTYKRLSAVFDGIVNQQIVNHEELSDGVYLTTYENQRAIVVNYTPHAYSYHGTMIAARDFAQVAAEN